MLAELMEPKSQPKQQYQAQNLEMLGLMTTGIAHDFNNLLTSIVGQASLALIKLPPGDAARFHIEKAMKAAEYATTLTRQLLSYAHNDQQHIELIDLNQLVSDNVALLEMVFLDGVALQLDLAPFLPAIEAKRGQMQQLVMNLIINAAEAIHSPTGTVTIRTGRETLPGSKNYRFGRGVSPPFGDYVFLQVSDSGVGMDEATLAHIFTPFFTTKPKGRGLGLSTILDIARSHQGSIAIESEVGRGSTFTIFLPYQRERKVQPPRH